jgi:type IV pilus assembly protein PilM
MSSVLSRFARVELAPPAYLAPPATGIDISTSGIKVAILKERVHGIELAHFAEEPLPLGTVTGGEITDRATVVKGLVALMKRHHVARAAIALPESRGYLFEADVAGATLPDWRVAIESRLDEYVPLPPAEVTFDILPLRSDGKAAHVVGVGYARRVVEESLAALDEAGIEVEAVESETFALPRALLANGNTETVLIIDIGKTTTKLMVATSRVPRFVTTFDVGGHALTTAIMKHFGVSEEEAKQVKAERGIVPGSGNEEYLAAMLSTVSVIREEIARRLEYWQTHASEGDAHEPVTRALLVGGNATVLGLPEYLEASLKVPVELGDVFANFAPRSAWLPPLEYTESLAYGTAIGLALRHYAG